MPLVQIEVVKVCGFKGIFFGLLLCLLSSVPLYAQLQPTTPAAMKSLLGQMQKKTTDAKKVFKDVRLQQDGSDKQAFFEGDDAQKTFKIKSSNDLMSLGNRDKEK